MDTAPHDWRSMTWWTRHDMTDAAWHDGHGMTWRTQHDMIDTAWHDGHSMTWRTQHDMMGTAWHDGHSMTWRTQHDMRDTAEKAWHHTLNTVMYTGIVTNGKLCLEMAETFPWHNLYLEVVQTRCLHVDTGQRLLVYPQRRQHLHYTVLQPSLLKQSLYSLWSWCGSTLCQGLPSLQWFLQ